MISVHKSIKSSVSLGGSQALNSETKDGKKRVQFPVRPTLAPGRGPVDITGATRVGMGFSEIGDPSNHIVA